MMGMFQVSLSTMEMCAEQTQDVLPNYSDPVQPVGCGFLTRVLWAYPDTTHTIKAGMHHDVSAGVCHLQSLCQQEPEVSPGSEPVLHGFLHSEFKISKVIALLSYWMITWSKATKMIQLLMIRLKVGLRCENISKNQSLCVSIAPNMEMHIENLNVGPLKVLGHPHSDVIKSADQFCKRMWKNFIKRLLQTRTCLRICFHSFIKFLL